MDQCLIVDGYNLLGVRGNVRGETETERTGLVRDLARYSHLKRYRLLVVFDGWRTGYTVEEWHSEGGVTVIFSKRGERADQVIQRLCDECGRNATIVSSDREVGNYARLRGNFVMTSAEFDARLTQALTDDHSKPARNRHSAGRKKGNPRKLPKRERQRIRRMQ